MLHAQIILAECLLWLFLLLQDLPIAQSREVLLPSLLFQTLVFGYGILIHHSWLSGQKSPWLRPVFFWLPQLVFVQLYPAHTPAGSASQPLSILSAVMPVNLAVPVMIDTGGKAAEISINLIAVALFIIAWRTDLKFFRPPSPATPATKARRTLASLMRVALILAGVVGCQIRLINSYSIEDVQKSAQERKSAGDFNIESITTKYNIEKINIPIELTQFKLKSGHNITTNQLRRIKWQDGSSSIELIYESDPFPGATDIDGEQTKSMKQDIAEIGQRLRDFAQAAGAKGATVRAVERAAERAAGRPRMARSVGMAWQKDDHGAWQPAEAEPIPYTLE